MTQKELENKAWWRMSKVLYFIFVAISLIIVLAIANVITKEQKINLDETYNKVGAQVRSTKLPWFNGSDYPAISTATNYELGEAFYQNRFSDQRLSKIWSNKKGVYEIYQNKYNNNEQLFVYLIGISFVFALAFFIKKIVFYIAIGSEKE